MTQNADLISRLRALARAEHLDLEVADEAADLIEKAIGILSMGNTIREREAYAALRDDEDL